MLYKLLKSKHFFYVLFVNSLSTVFSSGDKAADARLYSDTHRAYIINILSSSFL